VVFVPVDFDREPLQATLEKAGFDKQQRSLFILEGLLMYLRPESVDETFRQYGYSRKRGARWSSTNVYASVLRRENTHYGEAGIVDSVAKAGEKWQFGIEEEKGRYRLPVYLRHGAPRAP